MNLLATISFIFFFFGFATKEDDSTPRLRRNLKLVTKSVLVRRQLSHERGLSGRVDLLAKKGGDSVPGCKLSDKHRNTSLDFCVKEPERVTAVYVERKDGAKLGRCQGDCDKNEDCAKGLVCHFRNPGDGAPGCSYDSKMLSSRTDLCIPAGMAVDPVKKTVVKLVGNKVGNLGQCEGSCDNHLDCAEGLYCFQREPDYTVPGCELSKSILSSGANLCVK